MGEDVALGMAEEVPAGTAASPAGTASGMPARHPASSVDAMISDAVTAIRDGALARHGAALAHAHIRCLRTAQHSHETRGFEAWIATILDAPEQASGTAENNVRGSVRTGGGDGKNMAFNMAGDMAGDGENMAGNMAGDMASDMAGVPPSPLSQIASAIVRAAGPIAEIQRSKPMIAGRDSNGVDFDRVYRLTLASLVAVRIAERLEGIDPPGSGTGVDAPHEGKKTPLRTLLRTVSADHPSASRSAFSRALRIALKDRIDHMLGDS